MKNSLAFLKYSFLALWLVALVVIGYITIWPTHPPCANSISCVKDLSGSYEPELSYATYEGRTYPVPKNQPTNLLTDSRVLGAQSNKRIEVDLTVQRLYAFEGEKMIYNFVISSGKWNATPTGTFRIWIKLRYTRMEGGVPGTPGYYNTPNVPYTMFFANDQIPKWRGFALHGAYWHNKFGIPQSHGCINIKPEEAALLYAWADPPTVKHTTYATEENPGTFVTIYGTPPSN